MLQQALWLFAIHTDTTHLHCKVTVGVLYIGNICRHTRSVLPHAHSRRDINCLPNICVARDVS